MMPHLELFSLWAKSEPSLLEKDVGSSCGAPRKFHPLIYHLLDVGACAEALLHQEEARVARLAKACAVDAADLSRCFVALIALHDIGKCARGFQGKVPDLWPNCLGPKAISESSVRHDAAGAWLFYHNATLKEVAKRLLPGLSSSTRLLLIQSICGHHGQPIERIGDSFSSIGNPGRDIGAKAQEAAAAIAEAIVALLEPSPCRIDPAAAALASFWLAGLAVLSDWLGSNQAWFEFQMPPRDGDLSDNMKRYWNECARPNAERALKKAGLASVGLSRKAGLAHLFDPSYVPTPLQCYAQTVALHDGPSLFIIEDMTGAGKTEAAVILAHRLMLAGKAQGLHVALPTMATANAMFERLATHYRKMFAEKDAPSIVLSHGRRDLFKGFVNLPDELAHYKGDARNADDPSEIDASAFCADWLARSNKQAFLAQVGAGTVDQALLSVLPARHQSLRLWGLADKVLVIDEAHAYDAYMGEEIERLLHFHAALGGSAIVLSATLPQEKRGALVNAFLKGLSQEEKPNWRPIQSAYPLATSIALDHIDEEPHALRESLAREVVVTRIGTLEDVHANALEAARRGGAVAIIRNTVNEAIESFEALSKAFEGDVILFHARFAMVDRQKIEEDVLARFGKNSPENRNAILVATQVVEQSLDLDFDLIISDLAPVDLLIQRAGRLWRHQRGIRPVAGPNFLVFSPEPLDDVDGKWPAPLLPKTGFVYKNIAVLWRSAKAIFSAGKIVSRTSSACAPAQTGEIRALVEAAYGKDTFVLPPALEDMEIVADGDQHGERTHAGFKLLEFDKGYDWYGVKWERDTKVKTRLGEQTITLRLARIEEGRLVPWAPVEAGDWRRAWALSEVNLRRSQCGGSDNSPEVEKLVDAERRHWTISEKEIPVVVLTVANEALWQGVVLNKKEKPETISYSEMMGVRLGEGEV